MWTKGIWALCLLGMIVGLPAPATSVADVCDDTMALAAGVAVLPDTLVVGTLSHYSPGVCGLEAHFVSAAGACPTGFTGSVDGAFCGPLVPAGGVARCAWEPLLGGPSALVVGYDLPVSLAGYDGNLNLAGSEGPVVVLEDEGPTFQVANTHSSFVGKLIAYPTNLGLGFSPEDVTEVTCVYP